MKLNYCVMFQIGKIVEKKRKVAKTWVLMLCCLFNKQGNEDCSFLTHPIIGNKNTLPNVLQGKTSASQKFSVVQANFLNENGAHL